MTSMTKEEKRALPTIIDVLEELAEKEYLWHKDWARQPNFLAPHFAEDGEYMFVAPRTHSPLRKLLAGSLSTFTLYRGQNRYFPNCVPSLYRKPKEYTEEEWKVISRVRTAEFMWILMKHPVARELQSRIVVDLVPLAQHYGFPTEYMDVTNNKWVAAFFAVTQFNDDTYTPVDEQFEEGVGVFYVADPKENMAQQQLWFEDKLQTLGFQYFARPTRQHSMVYRMEEKDDFNQIAGWRKILFRHDRRASEIVYNMAWNQERWFPKDVLSDKARMIRSEGYEVSEAAIKLAIPKFNLSQSEDEVKAILERHGLRWHAGDEIYADFTDQEREADWHQWCEFGRADLMRRIKQPFWLYDLPEGVLTENGQYGPKD